MIIKSRNNATRLDENFRSTFQEELIIREGAAAISYKIDMNQFFITNGSGRPTMKYSPYIVELIWINRK